METIAFVGRSDSGKTRLITKLVPVLKESGLTVAVVKHCSHGFDCGGKDKDSSKYLAAGADGVALAAPGRTALLTVHDREGDLAAFAAEYFGSVDLVLVEGGKSNPGLRKVEVLRHGHSDQLQTPPQELAALVADFDVAIDCPRFHPDQVREIADWIVRSLGLNPRPGSRHD
jgi:molybdopterin-guanine dinucleotide biosynthesis adapter protein